ncbi:hypothetical protein CLAIMM_02537 [Cladophialophora immunda]|nr:hypothetical protein CLAIMM_02537 [Cladophialophora immunda]
MNTNSTSTAKNELLEQLTAQVGDISIEPEGLSTVPTSPITLVPSLTNSRHSRSSFSISEGSPCTAAGSPKNYFESFLPHNSHGAVASPKMTYEASVGSGIYSINPPPQSNPRLFQDGQLCWTPQPTNLSSGSKYPPAQHLPNSDDSTTTTQLPQGFEGHKEVSYIDWDDEDDRRRHYSPLLRIKKSFTDLRAAERFIADANARMRINLSQRKEAKWDVPDAQRHEAYDAYQISGRHRQPTHSAQSTPLPVREENSLTRFSSKLRKRPNANFRSHGQPRVTALVGMSQQRADKGIESTRSDGILSAPPRDTAIPPTPPSTGKRKRANTMTSERSREVQKKKVKLGVVGKLVTRLLVSKRER